MKLNRFYPCLTSVLLLITLVWCAAPANAQLAFTLTPPLQIVPQGGGASFAATLENQGDAEVFLNNDSFVFNFPGLTLDDIDFFLNTPTSMQPGETWSGNVFSVYASLGATPGPYAGEFAILGGVDVDGLAPLATQSFTVTVTASAAPEPATLGLLIVGGITGISMVGGRFRKG